MNAIAAATRTARDGQPAEAVEQLRALAAESPSVALDEALVALRHDGAIAMLDAVDASAPVDKVGAGPTGPLREVDAADLSVEVLRDGLRHSGCLLVRGLVDPGRAAALRDDIDEALAAFDRGLAGEPAASTTPLYRPFRPSGESYRIGGRKWMRESGGMWTVDSPRMLGELCRLLDEVAIIDLVTAFLGARPMLSANKCNIRRVEPTSASNWHQDGAFLGDIPSLNLWLALGPCGIEAPGLDIVPRRLEEVVATGTDGAWFDWSVAPDVVDEVAGGVAVLRPEFGAGDALLFDHLLLHRTGVSESMTRPRHAIETWFFSPAHYPQGQIPVLL